MCLAWAYVSFEDLLYPRKRMLLSPCILFPKGFDSRAPSFTMGIGCTRDHFKSEESESSCILKEGCICEEEERGGSGIKENVYFLSSSKHFTHDTSQSL